MRIRFALFLFIFVVAHQVWAVSAYLSMGYGNGGSALSELTGGQNYNTHAGSGLFMTGGALFALSPTVPHRFELQLGLGYLFQDDAREEENRVSWSRVPLEALYYYRNTQQHFRLGWGATYHIGNKISAEGANAGAETRVDNSLGWLISAEKLFSSEAGGLDGWSLGFRYLWINYDSSSFARQADGSAWFLTFSLVGS